MTERTTKTDRGQVLKLVAVALGIRLLLVPLAHPWDGQTLVNAFAELAQPGSLAEAVARPYETERGLSLLTQAAGRQADHYEYWAYPPFMLYILWPLAQAYRLVGGELQPTFPVQPVFVAPALPIAVLFLTRLPVILADLGALIIMRALGVSLGELKWYAFNPLVLLAGIWTFDAVMVLFLLLAILLAERHQWIFAGLALGLGTATKFIPLVALPAFGLRILASDTSGRSKAASFGALFAGILVSLAVTIAPALEGVRYVLEFHADRFGQGLSVDQILWLGIQPQLGRDWVTPAPLYATPLLGQLSLAVALLAAAWAISRRASSLRTGVLVMFLAFLVGSKLVNEPYVLIALASLTVVLAAHPSEKLRTCRTFLWGLGFAYAVLNMPPWAFFLSVLQQVIGGSAAVATRWADAYRVFHASWEALAPLAALALAFGLTAALASVLALRQDAGLAGSEELA